MPMRAEFPSPNFGPRRNGVLPDLIVLHYTAMPSCAEAAARLCDAAAEVSAHYLISERGAVQALVPEELRAWHAGAGGWGGAQDVNSRSIGIELANPGDAPFSEPQMAALEGVLADVMARWQIAAARVIGHSDMAPGRKADPGPRFDWQRLARRGLSVWPEPGAEPGDFRADARRFGYPDVADDLLLAAFRLRFRPMAQGPLDAVDAAWAADLAARFPVDAVAFAA
ncbi:N-acetylmuramoyl-L-alanine amidase [Gemmobacter fulvus]|uniref:N-acetylmuramoyl-L-alanine amidase n=1 Tax=Gemmobacter fulvus TaxID=2840474 RepID=UPI002796C9EE|nr:N-acetylmuramoyl-L-alanine amidase [Gemmobacter fulvus]MDQ1849065.1 N-acetylmuramoyl-L-alanine amidase [Gemmobacter fulvus]